MSICNDRGSRGNRVQQPRLRAYICVLGGWVVFDCASSFKPSKKSDDQNQLAAILADKINRQRPPTTWNNMIVIPTGLDAPITNVGQ